MKSIIFLSLLSLFSYTRAFIDYRGLVRDIFFDDTTTLESFNTSVTNDSSEVTSFTTISTLRTTTSTFPLITTTTVGSSIDVTMIRVPSTMETVGKDTEMMTTTPSTTIIPLSSTTLLLTTRSPIITTTTSVQSLKDKAKKILEMENSHYNTLRKMDLYYNFRQRSSISEFC